MGSIAIGWGLACVASLLLSGCGGGGPGSSVTGICKSCKPYFVRGSWHYPQNYYDYDEIGLASWYGPGFHGKPKPYGEPFDQHAMTAAHKTLPLPTVVLVTNLETGRSITVLVDDRGPFVYEGRIIDLSMGAAKALGCYQKGTAKVRVQALVKESKALSNHLTRYGPSGRDPSGRTWWDVYEQEIAGRHREEENIQITPEKPKSHVSPPFSSIKPDISKIQPQAISNPQPTSSSSSMDHLLKNLNSPSPRIQTSSQSEIYVTIGSDFIQRKNAEALLVGVASHYPASRITEVLTSSGQKFYRVQMGPFKDPARAESARRMMEKKSLLDTLVGDG